MRQIKIKKNSQRFTKLKFFSLFLAIVLVLSQSIWMKDTSAANAVYLDGVAGKDSNSGASPAEAVHSLGKAKELTAGGGSILVSGTLSVSGETTWSLPGGVTLQRAPGFSGAIVNITGTLTLKNISLSAADISGSGSLAGETKPESEKETTPEVEQEAKPEPTPEVTPQITDEPAPDVTAEPTPEPTAEPQPDPEAVETPVPEESMEPELIAEPEVSEEAKPSPEVEEPQPDEEGKRSGDADGTENTEATDTEAASQEEQKTENDGSDEETLSQEESSDKVQSEENVRKEPEEKDGQGKSESDNSALISMLQNIKVTVENGQDIDAVVAAAKAFDLLDDEKKAEFPQELVNRLKKAQLATQSINRISNGISVSGDLPWYVQFRVTKGNSMNANTFDLGELLGSYEMKLWNLLTDSVYKPEGAVTVTVPIDDPSQYKDISVIHYLPNGGHEVLTPTILPNAISFVTTSFSPYNITGNVLVGNVDKVYAKPDEDKQDSSQQKTTSGSGTTTGNNGLSTRSTNMPVRPDTVKRVVGAKTGDTTNLIPMICIGAGAVIVILALVIIGKKKNKK